MTKSTEKMTQASGEGENEKKESVVQNESQEGIKSPEIAELKRIVWDANRILSNEIAYCMCHMSPEDSATFQARREQLNDELSGTLINNHSPLYNDEVLKGTTTEAVVAEVREICARINALHEEAKLKDRGGVVVRQQNSEVIPEQIRKMVPEQDAVEVLQEPEVSRKDSPEAVVAKEAIRERKPLLIEGMEEVGGRHASFKGVCNRIDIWLAGLITGDDEYDDSHVGSINRAIHASYNPNERQQQKLLAVLENVGNTEKTNEIWNSEKISNDSRSLEELRGRIQRGELNEYDALLEINRLLLPMSQEEFEENKPVEMTGEINKYGLYARLVHKTLGHAVNKKSKKIEVDDLSQFYERYKNPKDLEYMSTELLKVIRNEYPNAEHLGLLREFNHLVFGKRAEYYEQYKLIEMGILANTEKVTENLNTETILERKEQNQSGFESANEIDLANMRSESTSEGKEGADKSRENQDAVLELQSAGAFGVFDGVGGSEAGSKASRIIRNHLETELQNIPKHLSLIQAEEYIKKTLLDSNEVLLEQARRDKTDMATTAVVCIPWKDSESQKYKLIVAHVGDSRAYQMRGGELHQLTVDHSRLNSFIKDPETRKKFQKITSNSLGVEEIIKKAKSQLRIDEDTERSIRLLYQMRDEQQIKQALGRENVEPTVHSYDIEPGDEYFLCSDGITDNLMDDEILKHMLKNGSMTDIKNVAKKANRKPDDISALRIQIPGK